MEMPIDVINKHLADRMHKDFMDPGEGPSATSLRIDEELQEKFIFFPDAELSEISEGIDSDRGRLVLGQGMAHLNVPADISVKDAYTLAENALAIWWLRHREEEMEAERLAKRPEPGVYQAYSGFSYFTVIVPEDRRILVQATAGGGLADRSGEWDASTNGPWHLQRIDTTTGTITKEN